MEIKKKDEEGEGTTQRESTKHKDGSNIYQGYWPSCTQNTNLHPSPRYHAGLHIGRRAILRCPSCCQVLVPMSRMDRAPELHCLLSGQETRESPGAF